MYSKTNSVKSGRLMRWNPFSLKCKQQQPQQKQLYSFTNNEASTIVGSSTSTMMTAHTSSNSIASGLMSSMVHKNQIPEETFVDTLTATIMNQNQTELLSDNDNDNIPNIIIEDEGNTNEDGKDSISGSMMDDLSEIKSVSSMNSSRASSMNGRSRVDIFHKKPSFDRRKLLRQTKRKSSRSLVSGKVFFNLIEEREANKTPNGVIFSSSRDLTEGKNNQSSNNSDTAVDLQLGTTKIPKNNEIPKDLKIHHHNIPEDSEIYRSEPKKEEVLSMHKEEEKKDDNTSSPLLESHEIIAQEIKNEMNNSVDYFATGRAIFERGEELVVLGQMKEAKNVFMKAQEYQRESITRLSTKLATMLHTQGLNHCDSGDKQLASVLLGAAEILKHRPNDIATIALVTQTQIGYRKVCPKRNPAFRLPRRAMDKTVRQLGLQASSMAEITKAYASTLRDCY
mmetsp:Transcript_26757/g.29601  ORF Transcript_26757/g.29601 Transcript_26757/m.29601 type:complete len:452 (+) Transcript_26757:37-1392(+)